MDRARVREKLYSRLGWLSYDIPWLEESGVDEFHRDRDALYQSLIDNSAIALDSLKPRYGPLSPGCEACRAGTWSCLFINNRCNANCFWCLRDQRIRRDPPPSAHGLEFYTPELYSAFLKRSGYNAVGLSGGEPLLAFRSLIEYVRTLRQELGPDAWLWIYTNGILASSEKADALTDAGLNEIRVDIAANGYNLSALEKFAGHIPLLSVEIPCLPEDEERLKRLLPELQRMGVSHLNLHQLTANPDNISGYLGRGYTFLHHPELTVLESEMTALRLVRHAAEMKLEMGVQVCSKPYKRWAQGSSRRFRALQFTGFTKSISHVTRTGFLRELIVRPPEGSVGEVGTLLRNSGYAETEWERIGESERFRISPAILQTAIPARIRLSINYYEPRVVSTGSGRVSGEKGISDGWSMQYQPAGDVFDLNREEIQWLRDCAVDRHGIEADRPIPERLAPWESPAASDDVF